MRKKLIKLISEALPTLYDRDGESLSKRSIANKVLDAIPYPEVLDIQPFETWVPFACSSCFYNGGISKGCLNGIVRSDEQPPEDCPLEY
jgi:hypothetical protein